MAKPHTDSNTAIDNLLEPPKHPTLLALGERVRALRARRGLTRKTLAQVAQVSERHLANLEGGVGNASVLILQQVADALVCSVAELLGDETTGSPQWLLLRDTLQNRTPAELKLAHLAAQRLFAAQAPTAQTQHIALLGLRGAGKSSLGAHLAQHMSCAFVELNTVIAQLAGCGVAEIHARLGANAYRALERQALVETLASAELTVIAMPGGLVADISALNLVLQACKTVWIQATPDEHMARVLAQGDTRPMRGNREAMGDLRRILAARSPFYALAEVHFQNSGTSIVQASRALTTQLKSQLQHQS